MSIDAYNLQKTKELILAFIKARGPSLPVHIARDVKTSPLFAAAFLSELYNEQKLRMSHMKVGSTSLYLLPGQESQLENFTQYLNHKEKEAVQMLKQSVFLEDEKIPPAIRVALRELKDFAIPEKQTINGQEKIIWKYAYPSQEIPVNIQHPLPVPASVQQTIPQSIIQATMPQQVIIPEPQIQETPIIQKPIKEKKERKPIIPKEKPNFEFSLTAKSEEIPEIIETPFGKHVRRYCNEKSLEIVKIEEEKGKNFSAILSLETPVGKQNYYCIAKDKKKINEQDIQQALQLAQKHRMPTLILISAPLDKKGISLMSDWQHMIKVDKLKI